MTSVSIALVLLAIGATSVAARPSIGRVSRWPIVTSSVMALLAICLIAQLRSPELLTLYRRDADALQSGQFYRLLTALWFQDGGLAGGLFNLAMLGLVGFYAERRFARPLWATLYFSGGLLAEMVALGWQPIGAGNSVAYLSLSGGLLAAALTGSTAAPARVAALIGLGAGTGLCLLRDVHGPAIFIGGIIYVGSIWAAKAWRAVRTRSRPRPEHD